MSNVNLYKSSASQLNKLLADLKEKKCELILDFINEFMEDDTDTVFSSLCEFRNIDVQSINKKQFKKTLRKYQYNLEKELSICIDDTDNITDKTIMSIIDDCLCAIDYTLQCKQIKSEEGKIISHLLFIFNKPNTKKST